MNKVTCWSTEQKILVKGRCERPTAEIYVFLLLIEDYVANSIFSQMLWIKMVGSFALFKWTDNLWLFHIMEEKEEECGGGGDKQVIHILHTPRKFGRFELVAAQDTHQFVLC